MRTINISQARAQFSRLVQLASKGETVVIAKSGTPLARLVPLDGPKPGKIKFGTLKGEFEVPDDFDAPLPDWLLDLFEGKSQ